MYWEDFYSDWWILFFVGTAATLTWINADAHSYKYDAYANHKGGANFCMDDFDDSVVGDYQFGLWRMAISLVLDCRNNGVFGDKAQKKALSTFSEAYRKEMLSFSDKELEVELHFMN